ncbi:uroporphyrinogen-III synthase [Polymorphospora rubra]|uniref:uroporphyrinogen-III synthase n=1 Tax=Polymorphospora rubra TaxID=338584 RepID=UPI0033D50DEC
MTGLGPVLAGTRVLVTAQRRADELASALQRRGASVTIAASIGVESHIDEATVLDRTREFIAAPADVVVVTTGIGFRSWLDVAETSELGEELVEALSRSRLIARGPKARGALQAAGLTPDWVAESETSAEIGDFLSAEGIGGQRVVVQHHGAGDDGLEERLTAAGAATTGLVVYRWGAPPDPTAVQHSVRETAAGGYDAVAFTSAPGAAAWLRAVREQEVSAQVVAVGAAGRTVFASVGNVTAEPLRTAGLDPVVPERARLGALVRSIIMRLGDDSDSIATAAGRLRIRATAATLDHRVLPVSPGGLCLLRSLAERPGAVKSREELLADLPGGSSDPHTVEMAVGRLRDIVGREVVQTVVKRGYRLAVPS